jgi:drug/metabolite transporter (DMT)-like permease
MSPLASILALSTVALWSFLAFLAAQVNHLPPFLVVAVALTVSGLLSTFRIADWRVPAITLLVGIGGIFGYHFLYFSAFKYAPAVEANLMNYLWPLLIVLLSPLYLPGFPLRSHHLLGAFLGLAGAGLIITGGRFSLDLLHLKGYLLAAGAAFTWASYSLLTKRLPPFPSGAVGAFCLASGLLSYGAYLLTSPTIGLSDLSRRDWISLILLGIGPMGLAFFTWDAALKRGDPRIIGSLAYLTPLTSTLVLVLLGGQHMTWLSVIAMLLIVSGAVIGSWELISPSLRDKLKPVVE